jgi:hypothetical protein
MPRTSWFRGFVHCLVCYRWDADGLVTVLNEHPVRRLELYLDSLHQDITWQLLSLAAVSTFDQLKSLAISTEMNPSGETIRALRSVDFTSNKHKMAL